jgi:hypothetical protein
MTITKIRIKTLLVLLVVLLPVIGIGRAFAASTGVVTSTVTPLNISVAVADGTVSYGALDLSSNEDTTNSGVNDSQTATNDGNVAEDFNIRSTNATGGTAWTISDTAIGPDQYMHQFCTTTCDSSPTWTPMTTNYAALASNIATSGNQVFDLRIDTPSSSSDYLLKTITVTVQAVIH